MRKDIQKLISLDNRLKTYHLKILLLLDIQEYSQSDLVSLLNINKQYVNKNVKELKTWGYIEVSRKIGVIKYLKLCNNTEIEFKGQLKFI